MKIMDKCRWCEEPAKQGGMFCDDLCERLYNDYWSTQGAWHQYANQDRSRRDAAAKRRRANG